MKLVRRHVQARRLIWIRELRQTSIGDANLDGVFDSEDLVLALQGGKYVVDVGNAKMATWTEGDWNGDMRFDSGDLVFAYQDYVGGPTPVVPEPDSLMPVMTGAVGMAIRRRFAR